MADTNDAKKTTPAKTKTRGASFPTLSLPEAVKVIREAGQYGKQHTPGALAAYAGHQSANSGPWKQKAAALREWGLITTVSADKITLTDRAIRIAHPESTEKTQAAMLECFKGATLYMKIYGDLARGAELNVSTLASKAISDHGVGIGSKDKFVRSFLESATAVGLAERVGTDKFKTFPMPEVGSGSTEDETDDESADEPDERINPSTAVHRRTAGTPVMQQAWPFANGEVTLSITSTAPLQAKSYTEVAKVVAAIEALVNDLGPIELSDGASN